MIKTRKINPKRYNKSSWFERNKKISNLSNANVFGTDQEKAITILDAMHVGYQIIAAPSWLQGGGLEVAVFTPENSEKNPNKLILYWSRELARSVQFLVNARVAVFKDNYDKKGFFISSKLLLCCPKKEAQLKLKKYLDEKNGK